MEVKFGDSEKVQEILQVITPLKEIILCSPIVKDIAKQKDCFTMMGNIMIFLTNVLLLLT